MKKHGGQKTQPRGKGYGKAVNGNSGSSGQRKKSPIRGDSRIQVTGKGRRFIRLSEHRVISVKRVEGC